MGRVIFFCAVLGWAALSSVLGLGPIVAMVGGAIVGNVMWRLVI